MTRGRYGKKMIFYRVIAPQSRHKELRFNDFFAADEAYSLSNRLTRAGLQVTVQLVVNGETFTTTFPPKVNATPVKGFGRVTYPTPEYQRQLRSWPGPTQIAA